MKTLIWPLFVLVVLSIGFLVFAHDSIARLPEKIATHFGTNGTPNGWMNRDNYFLFMVGMGLGLSWLLACIGLLCRFIPARFVNIPNRDYWFSPERKQESCLYFSRYMIWMCCLTISFFAGMHYTVVKANQSSPVKMPNEIFWPLLIGYLIVTGIWSIAVIMRFSKKHMIEE